jgi:hypothetical protein
MLVAAIFGELRSCAQAGDAGERESNQLSLGDISLPEEPERLKEAVAEYLEGEQS